MLLLQLRKNTPSKNYKKSKYGQTWLLVKGESRTIAVPADLAKILYSEKKWLASSYTSKFGRLTLVLTARNSEHKLAKIQIVELAKDCSIVLERVKTIPEPSPDSSVKDVGVLHN